MVVCHSTFASCLTLVATLSQGMPAVTQQVTTVVSPVPPGTPILYLLGGFALTIEVILLNLAALIFRDADPKRITIALAAFSVGGIISRISLPHLLQSFRLNMKHVLLTCNLACFAVCIALFLRPAMPLFFLAGLSSSILIPTLISALTSTEGIDAGQAVSRFWGVATGMLIIYLLLNLLVVNSKSLTSPVLTVLIVCLLSLICLLSKVSLISLDRPFHQKV